LNLFSFEDKDPVFTSLKQGLALRLLSKGLFYIRAMVENYLIEEADTFFIIIRENRQSYHLIWYIWEQ
jgi:hypothetical protein